MLYEDLADDTDWDAIYRQIAEDLLSGADYLVNADLHLATAKKLCAAVDAAISGEPSYDDRKKLIAELKQNIYPFSAAKSFQQMVYYRNTMHDKATGKILGKDAFIKKIADTGEIFNKRYLTAEYENAYFSTIMADKWERLDSEYIEYSTVGDGRVRETHRKLDKFTAKKTDPVWKRIYPPNGWNCRCNVIPGKEHSNKNKLNASAAGGLLKEELKDTTFDNNVGISKLVFKNNHPYFNNFNTNIPASQYGLPTIEKIRTEERPNIPNKTLEEYLKWWDKQPKSKDDDILISDYFGNHLDIQSGVHKSKNRHGYFKDHIIRKQDDPRYRYGEEVSTVLTDPDEVWYNPIKKTKYYLKFYEEGTLKVIVNENRIVHNMYLIDKGITKDEINIEKNKLNDVRQGILLHR